MEFVPQRIGAALGLRMARELAMPSSMQVDMAIAWVRASGLLHLQDGLGAVLRRGGTARVVVGLDGDNTSQEGLKGLLDIAAAAAAGERFTAFVRHNEAGPIFHPKMYALRSAEEIAVYIGSNNLTLSGLFLNEELSARLVDARGGPLEGQLDQYMTSLTDPASGLALELNEELLGRLVERGYVRKEASLRASDRARSRSRPRREPLFANLPVRPPRAPAGAAGPVPAPKVAPPPPGIREDWPAVYLRLRLARGTQSQIPIQVVKELRRRIGLDPEERGPLTLVNRHDGTVQSIRPAGQGKQANTYKFEAREVEGEPLLRIYPVGDQLFYEFFDSGDALGRKVMQLLLEGFEADPPTTFQTVADRAIATWFRFD